MDYSILIPVYKAERYLEETVRSALAQEGSFSFEILLAEDGSPDESGLLCDRLAAEHPERIRVLHRPHQGTVLTRRAAVEAAAGDYILWLDSDDLLSPRCLLVIDAYRRAYPQAQILLYEMCFFLEAEGKEEHRLPLYPAPVLLEGARKEELYRLLIEGNRLDSLCIKAIRGDLLRQDPSDYSGVCANPYGEDVLHALYPLTRAESVLYMPEELYTYRIHDQSVMHTFDEERMADRLNTAKWDFFAPFMKSWGMDSPPWQDRLRASGYKAVLDGLLHLWMHGGDRKKLQAFTRRFAGEHPELKRLANSPHLAKKLRVQLFLFSRSRLRLLVGMLKLYKAFQ